MPEWHRLSTVTLTTISVEVELSRTARLWPSLSLVTYHCDQEDDFNVFVDATIDDLPMGGKVKAVLVVGTEEEKEEVLRRLPLSMSTPADLKSALEQLRIEVKP